jgi:hypothetical protein
MFLFRLQNYHCQVLLYSCITAVLTHMRVLVLQMTLFVMQAKAL